MLRHICGKLAKCSIQNTFTYQNPISPLFCFPRWNRIHGARQLHAHNTSNELSSTVSRHSNHLLLKHEEQTTQLHFFWLRDHCRCPSCWNAKTAQKEIRFQDIDTNISPKEYCIEGENLRVTWPDDHISTFPMKWLMENDHRRSHVPKVEQVLWNGETYHNLKFERMKYKDFINEDECLKIFLKNFAKFGFGFVDEVPADEEHTQKVTERVGPIHECIFGRMWTFTSDGSRADTAFTNIALGAHTDQTYCHNPAGIQIFHCLYHDGKGGETLMEDGFHCAKIFRETNQDAFNTLANTYVHHDYIEPSHATHQRSLATILNVHPLTGELQQIRYNNYDRVAVDTIPAEKVMPFYEAVGALSEIVEDEANVHWEKLWPGTVYFLNNWRVFHGRTAFTGKRVVCGNYIDTDNWTNKARHFGVL